MYFCRILNWNVNLIHILSVFSYSGQFFFLSVRQVFVNIHLFSFDELSKLSVPNYLGLGVILTKLILQICDMRLMHSKYIVIHLGNSGDFQSNDAFFLQ